ncbi:MAG: hypothetical protein AAGI51_11280 [Pseudomonadota bacterium]
MAAKKGEDGAAEAGSGGLPADGASYRMVDGRLTVMGVDNASLQTFASGHAALDDLPDQSLAEYEAAAEAADRFSAESLDRASARSAHRPVRQVDEALRADLLERPHLFATPQENGRRGIVAVWRSLKDQLRDETLKMIDGSSRAELMMHRRELESRRAVVASVEKGLESLLERIDRRLAEGDDAPPEDERDPD